MAVRARHSKTSAVPDSGDTNLVQPSDWNADHPITSDGPGLVGRTAAGAGPVAEVSAADGRALLGLGNAATSALSTTNAAALGTAAPGSETTVARADHVHPMPTAAQVGAEPAGAINNRIQAGTSGGRVAVWNNTALRWQQTTNISFDDANGALNFAPNTPTAQAAVNVGITRTGDGPSFVDFYSFNNAGDNSARIIRNGGANGALEILQRGTGGILIRALNAGAVTFRTADTLRMSIDATGGVTIPGITSFGTSPRINAAAGTARRVDVLTNGSLRWSFGGTGEAESGSNAGTNWVLNRHDDAGVALGAALSINRATGVTTITSLTIGSNPTAAVQAGTVTGQLASWNQTTGRYEPVTLNTLPDAIDDAAAAGLGVAVGGLYRTGSTLKARIA